MKLTLLFIFWSSLVFAQDFSLLNQHMMGTTTSDNLTKVLRTSDNGYLLLAYTSGNNGDGAGFPAYGLDDNWIIKLDSQLQLQWQDRFGGSSIDQPYDAIELSDGSFVICGGSASGISGNKATANYGSSDFWVYKLNAAGQRIWEKTLGSTDYDGAQSLVARNDTLFVFGHSNGNADGSKTIPSYGSYDIWMVALDTAGNELFQRSYGGDNTDWLNTVGLVNNQIVVLSNSYSGVSGNKTSLNYGYSDCWLFTLDNFLAISNEISIGGNDEDGFGNFISTPQGIFLAGSSYSTPSGNKTAPLHGYPDGWIVQLDSSFNILNQWTYGSVSNTDFSKIYQLQNGNLLVTGTSDDTAFTYKTRDSQGSIDVYLVWLDANGNYLSNYSFGGDESDDIKLVSEINPNDFYLFGYTFSNMTGDFTVSNHSNGYTDLFYTELTTNLSVQNLSEKTGLKAYPNPFTDQLVLEMKQTQTVFLRDAQGRQLQIIPLQEGTNTLLLDQYDPGVYFIQTDTGSMRVVKQ